MNFWADLPRPFFVLAPMDDVTDTVFRQIIATTSPPDVYFTEFVSVDGLQSVGRDRLLKRLQMTPAEQPLVAQIWGKSPDKYYQTARQIADGTFARELGLPDGLNFAGVDINMGCPDKSIVKNGCCSALINDRPLAAEIIQAAQEGLACRLPLSLKTRVGFNKVDLSWIEFILGHGLQALTIHGRTKSQMSKVPADWELIGQARRLRDKISPNTKIIGNGDVRDRAHGAELASHHDLDGIMIGRGIFADPYAFAVNSPWEAMPPKDKIDLYRRHVQLFFTTWTGNERPIQTLNKFCKIYVNGFDGARELREKLMKARTCTELLDILNIDLTERD